MLPFKYIVAKLIWYDMKSSEFPNLVSYVTTCSSCRKCELYNLTIFKAIYLCDR